MANYPYVSHCSLQVCGWELGEAQHGPVCAGNTDDASIQ